MKHTIIHHSPDDNNDPRVVWRITNPPRIEALVWSATGPQEDTTARLLSTINIGGVAMHLEAFALRERAEDEEQAFVKLSDDAEFNFADEERALFTLNDQAMETILISGREYLLVAYPYGA